jgi:predicted transcriptional regulator
MTALLTPDEDAVLFEYHRRNIQSDKLDKKTIKEIAKSCNMSFERAGAAMLGLLEKDVFYVEEKKKREKKK